MTGLKEIKDSILHLLFPHVCAGCGTDVIEEKNIMCLRCMASLPETKFEEIPNNPVEKMFWGRLKLESATAQYYFTRGSLMQRLMHLFKYRGNREVGLQLGRMMGEQIGKSGRFPVDSLVALPLFPAKEKKRGYNQAEVLCQGISKVLNVPVLERVVERPSHTETQTKKGRIERWRNIEGKFQLSDPGALKNKHVLLVDDVITTGATLESCGTELLQAENLSLSVATLCVASR